MSWAEPTTYERYCSKCGGMVYTDHSARCPDCNNATEPYFPDGMPVNYANGGLWLDGPKFVEFLQEYMANMASGNTTKWVDGLQHRLREWERGVSAYVYTADPYLINLGLHPSMVPDDIWLPQNEWPVRKNAVEPKANNCKRGHEMTPENTRVDKRGRRECWQCRKIRQAQTDARRRRRIPAAPLAEWLQALHKELGTWKAVGKKLGRDHARVWALAKPKTQLVNRSAAERLLGDQFDAIYGPTIEAQVAEELAEIEARYPEKPSPRK